MRLRSLIVWCFLSIVLVSGRATAQLNDATLSGKVVDATGDGVPAADVDVVNAATGVQRSTTTDRTGIFRLAGLPPGSYNLEAGLQGFETVRRAGLRLQVGQTTDVTIQLQIAGLQETVSVTAQAVTIAVSREARLADSFGGSDIQQMPLPQRDIFALPKLAAGATLIPGSASC